MSFESKINPIALLPYRQYKAEIKEYKNISDAMDGNELHQLLIKEGIISETLKINFIPKHRRSKHFPKCARKNT
jgi:hypothetical protein